MKIDIEDFYLSTTESLLKDYFIFANNTTRITTQDKKRIEINII